MSNQSLFVQLSYALGAGLIVFGTPAALASGIMYLLLKRLEGES